MLNVDELFMMCWRWSLLHGVNICRSRQKSDPYLNSNCLNDSNFISISRNMSVRIQRIVVWCLAVSVHEFLGPQVHWMQWTANTVLFSFIFCIPCKVNVKRILHHHTIIWRYIITCYQSRLLAKSDPIWLTWESLMCFCKPTCSTTLYWSCPRCFPVCAPVRHTKPINAICRVYWQGSLSLI